MNSSSILASLIASTQLPGHGAALAHAGGDAGSAFADLLGAASEALDAAALATPQASSPSPSTPPAWTAPSASPTRAAASQPAPTGASPRAATTGFAASLSGLTASVNPASPSGSAAGPSPAPVAAETPATAPAARTAATGAAVRAVVAPSPFVRALGAQTVTPSPSTAQASLAGAETASPPSAPTTTATSKSTPPPRSAGSKSPATADAIDGALAVAQAAAANARPTLEPVLASKPASSGAPASAPSANATLAAATNDAIAAASTDDSLSSAAPVFPNASLSCAMQTISDALSGAAASAAQTCAALPAIVPSTAELRHVQSRTHLTVSGSRLFNMASPRARAALDATPTPAPTADKTSLAPAPPVAATGGATTVSASDDKLSSATFSQLVSSAGVGLNGAAAGGDTVSIDDLGARLAAEASTLADDSPTLARGAVKELQFQLEPADLGAVGVRLRLTTGGLSVDINVSNPSALVALEKQRDSMTAKLDASSQPLESLVIQQQSGAAFHDPSPAVSGSPSFAATGDAPSEGSSRRSARDSGARPRPAPAANTGSQQGSSVGALVV